MEYLVKIRKFIPFLSLIFLKVLKYNSGQMRNTDMHIIVGC
jgi:hypothetical protein